MTREDQLLNRSEIIRMAREAGIGPVYGYESIERFFQSAYAAGAAAAEREACAKAVLDERAAQDKSSNYYRVADRAIRARGKTSSRGKT